jgi:hypothetical protein
MLIQNLKIMKEFFISIRPCSNGYHFVHKHGCPLLPEPGKRILLGAFKSSGEALREGRKQFRKPVCCRFCSNEDNWRKVNPEYEAKTGTAFISSDNLTSTIESLMFCSVS